MAYEIPLEAASGRLCARPAIFAGFGRKNRVLPRGRAAKAAAMAVRGRAAYNVEQPSDDGFGRRN